MSYWRRTKLAIDSIRNLTSKPITHSHRHSSFHQINHYTTSNLPGKTPKPPLFSFSSIFPSSRNPNFPIRTSTRTYYVDRNQIQHFRPRGPAKWFQNPKNLLIIIILTSGVTISIYYGNIETIPYTKRNHFILLSTRMEKQMGEMQFQSLKKSLKPKILPGIHPESVRVKLIAREIIEALQRGIKQETVWSDPSYSSESSGASEESAQETMKALTEEVVGKGERESWHKDEEVLDDKWVQKSRSKAKERGLQPATSHLDGLHWEVIVVDEPVVNAFCLPGGKIVVFTGLLQHFQTDAEIATIIGHEVAHAVARHSAEGITKNMMEMEADYIGLLLLASAGYNPRVAPKVYEKLGQLGGESPLRDYLSTHPSGKKRARLLADAKVMEEAMTIYKEVRAGRLIEDFL